MFNYSIWFLVKAHWGLEFAKRYNMFGLNNYTPVHRGELYF